MPFLDLNTDVKPWLGIDVSVTSHDTTLTIIRDAVEQSVLNYTEVQFVSTGPVMEVYDASQSDIIVLQNFPVISVTAVYFDCKPDGTGGNLIDVLSYKVNKDQGDIAFQGGLYTPRGRAIVRIDYTHGYTSLPSDVKLAILLGIEANFRRKGNKTIGMTGRTKKDESEGYSSGPGAWDTKTGLPKEVVAMLNPYKRYEIPTQPMAQRNL